MSLLVVTAVEAERAAVLSGLPPHSDSVTVAVVGAGPAAAAAGTARLLTLAEAGGVPYRWVVSAGIAGAFPAKVEIGGVVLATRSVAADLGATSPEGFLPLDALGFGTTTFEADPVLLDTLRAALPGAVTGTVLTVSTVTGTEVPAHYPDAVAEAMEGYGVACAASLAGAGFAELRAISNVVGPRDRTAWRIRDALAALTASALAIHECVRGE